MSNFHAQYQSKLTTPEGIGRYIRSGAKIAMGLGVSQPPAILESIAEMARRGAFQGISVYALLSMANAGNTVLKPELWQTIRPYSFFHGAVERSLDRALRESGRAGVDFIPGAFSQIPSIMTDLVGVNVLAVTVSPMDDDGYFSLGTNADYALSVSRKAAIILLEVNEFMPRVGGNCKIHIDQVTGLIENHVPLIEVPPSSPQTADRQIAATVAGMIRDGDCVQMGIGALPDCVCEGLVHHKNLGIHTELMTPGLAALMQSGVIDNSRKTLHRDRGIFTFAMGDRAFYEFLNENPALEAHPVDYVNDPTVIAQNDNMISVNATMEVDLSGACNSEVLAGRQYSGSGGQLDFVIGASASRGGKSIIACHSTAKGGAVSRIVPSLTGAVTTPRNDVQYIVTEYGVAELRGKSLRQRAEALIAIAHPNFREDLEKAIYKVV